MLALGALHAPVPAFVQQDVDGEAAEPLRVSSGTIIERALALLGVPYRYGGNDPASGLDCSGLVRYVFSVAPGLELPRSAAAISKVGRSVRRDELIPGDLVFFNTRGAPFSHVAVYIGDGQFVHAPARRGVVRVEAMDQRYWQSRYNGARRLLDLPRVEDDPIAVIVSQLRGQPQAGPKQESPGFSEPGP